MNIFIGSMAAILLLVAYNVWAYHRDLPATVRSAIAGTPYVLDGWGRWVAQRAPWFPIQSCKVCSRWYWGGLPRWSWDRRRCRIRLQWMASWMDYCSKRCSDEELELLAATSRATR